MRFVGIDLHKQTITLVVVDAAWKLLARRRFSNLMFAEIVSFLKSHGEFQLTVEMAGTGQVVDAGQTGEVRQHREKERPDESETDAQSSEQRRSRVAGPESSRGVGHDTKDKLTPFTKLQGVPPARAQREIEFPSSAKRAMLARQRESTRTETNHVGRTFR